MGPYLSARLWARQATRGARAVAAVAGVVAVGAVGALVVPAASGPGEEVAATGGGPLPELSQNDVDTTPGPGATATSGTGTGTGTGTGATGVGTVGTGATGGPSGTTGPRTGSGSGSGSGSGPSGGGGSGGVDCSNLRDNDTGVTPKTITVGFGLVDFSGSGATNEAVADIRPDTDQVVQAYVDYANAMGGVACRTLVAKGYKANPLDSNDQTVKCKRATEDDKVFAFVDSYTMATQATQSCFTIDHKTPYITTTPLGEANLRAQYPYSISSSPSYDRSAVNWLRAAKDNGFFDPATGFEKLGLLGDDCLPEVNANIKSEAARLGIGDIAVFTFRCAAIATPGEAQQAVLAFDQANVTHVFGATFGINIGQFSVVAGQQEQHFRYGLSDMWSAANDDVIDFGDVDELHNAFATTATTIGRPWETYYQQPTSAWCNEALRRKGLRTLENGKDEEAAYLCGNFRLFLRMAELAGPSLTRRSTALALPAVGTFSFPIFADGNFAGKLSGGDQLALLRIDRGCACFQRTREFGPAYV